MTKEEYKAQSVTPQERAFVQLRKRLKQLHKEGAFDRYIAMEEDFDKMPSDPTVWDRLAAGDYDALTEMAIFSIRPDIHKPLRLFALREVMKITHTTGDLTERLQMAGQISNITIHIESYARGIPDKTGETKQIEPRKVKAEVVDD